MSLLFGPNLDQLLYCPAATLGPAITFAGWFYPITLGELSGQGGQGAMIWHENTVTDARPRVSMAWSPAGQLQMFSDFTGIDAEGISQTAATALNNWTWVGMTWNISTPATTPTFCSMLGTNFQSWTGATVAYTVPTGSPVSADGYNVRIGNDNRATRCFHGYIAETYVWRRMLTIDQMRAVAQNGPGAHLADIHFWYNPNQPLTPQAGTTGTTPDRSGNGRTGITLGGPVYTAFEPSPARPKMGRVGPQIVT